MYMGAEVITHNARMRGSSGDGTGKDGRQPSGVVAHAGFGFTFKKTSGADGGGWRVSRLKPNGFALSRFVLQYQGDMEEEEDEKRRSE